MPEAAKKKSREWTTDKKINRWDESKSRKNGLETKIDANVFFSPDPFCLSVLSVFGHLPHLLSLGSSSFLHVATIYRELAIIWFYYFYFRCVVRSDLQTAAEMFWQIKKVYDAHAYGSAILVVVVVVAFGFAWPD